MLSKRLAIAAPPMALALGFGLGLWVDGGGGRLLDVRPAEAAAPSARDGNVPESAEEAIYQSLNRQYEQFHQVNRTFELVSKVVSRGVAHISATKRREGREGRFRAVVEESGSGVIVRSDIRPGRFVLTNNHVVAGADTKDIRISLQDGRFLEPVEFWGDERSDIAVLELPVEDLPTVRLGDSDDVVPGTWVLAIGSPFGLTHSVSQGIISARGRQERDLFRNNVLNQDFLQTDAAINPGNSGGPLVNLRGEVVGINTAIASQGGGNEGVGYSVPINLARWAMNQLLENGKVTRGALGIHLEDLDAIDAQRLGLDRPHGTLIVNVTDASPAQRVGLEVGDVVIKFNGIRVRNTAHLINMISMSPIGKPAEIAIMRDGDELIREVRVTDYDSVVEAQPPAREFETSPGGYLRRP